MPTGYLTNLTMRLLGGASRLDEARRKELRSYFLASQAEDGGFSGRQGAGDLYYSAFALRGLFLLSVEENAWIPAFTKFLEARRQSECNAAELTSSIFCASLLSLFSGKETSPAESDWCIDSWTCFRRPDGCYATSENTPYSSTYMTFLAANSFELLRAMDRIEEIPIDPIRERQVSDGGFAELVRLEKSGTNPTAAAVGFLKMKNAEPKDRRAAIDFLLAGQLPSGGFRANTRIPVADLLSSFTAFVALTDLGADDECRRDELARFVTAMKTDDGGYRGAEWDSAADVEYTFYGLALESLLLLSRK